MVNLSISKFHPRIKVNYVSNSINFKCIFSYNQNDLFQVKHKSAQLIINSYFENTDEDEHEYIFLPAKPKKSNLLFSSKQKSVQP